MGLKAAELQAISCSTSPGTRAACCHSAQSLREKPTGWHWMALGFDALAVEILPPATQARAAKTVMEKMLWTTHWGGWMGKKKKYVLVQSCKSWKQRNSFPNSQKNENLQLLTEHYEYSRHLVGTGKQKTVFGKNDWLTYATSNENLPQE